MGSLFLRFLAACCLACLVGCAAKQPKSSSRIFQGESPSITYMSERETAGGPVGGR